MIPVEALFDVSRMLSIISMVQTEWHEICIGARAQSRLEHTHKTGKKLIPCSPWEWKVFCGLLYQGSYLGISEMVVSLMTPVLCFNNCWIHSLRHGSQTTCNNPINAAVHLQRLSFKEILGEGKQGGRAWRCEWLVLNRRLTSMTRMRRSHGWKEQKTGRPGSHPSWLRQFERQDNPEWLWVVGHRVKITAQAPQRSPLSGA